MKTPDFSFDIETMGTGPYSVVLAIGVAAFNRNTGELGPDLELAIDMVDSVKQGLRIEPDTVRWWLTQSDEARQGIANRGGSLDYALRELNRFLKDNGFSKSSFVWGNGSGFDINHLEECYAVNNKQPPWAFWQARDVRTAVMLAGMPKDAVKREGTHHKAKDDAIHQARLVIESTKRLKR